MMKHTTLVERNLVSRESLGCIYRRPRQANPIMIIIHILNQRLKDLHARVSD